MTSTLLKSLLKKVSTHIPDYRGQEASIANAIGHRLQDKDILDIKWLGEGFFADVFWLHDRKKVLKITTDRADADASFILQKKPSKDLVKVYDVFALSWQTNSVYGIVSEKLTPLSPPLAQKMEDLRILVFLQIAYDDPYLTNKLIAKIEAKRQDPNYRLNYDKETVDQYMEKHGLDDHDIQQLRSWAKALEDRRIRWKDFKPDNLMMRGNKMVISDLGYSNTPQHNLPTLDIEGF